jgi:VCBS repeat-containing protein
MPRIIICLVTIVVLFQTSRVTAQVTANDDDFLVNENEVWTGNLGENDILPAGQATFSVIEGPSLGEFTFTNGGNFEYTPPLNLFGFRDSVFYQVCVNNVCDIAGVEFYVIFRNTIPFAGEDFFLVEFNTPRIANVTANDGDPDSITDPIDTSLDWFKFTNPSNGIVNVFSLDGTFTYTPNSGFTGTDSFQYYVVDHCGLYAISTIYLTIVGPNLSPTASDQNINSLNEDVVYNGTLTSLVSDPENDNITYTLETPPTSGNLILLSNGSYSYTPLPNYTGTIYFTYNACDAVGQCDQGIVTLTVNNTDNDPPQLQNDLIVINEDNTGSIIASGNDFDDTGVMTYSVFSPPASGTAQLTNVNGQFSYSPNANYFGFDSFVVQACDGVNCSTSLVNIQVNGINDAPIASPFLLTINEDTNSTGSITAIIDAEPNALVFSTPGGNSITGLSVNSNGTYSYTAPAHYFGTQTINLQGCDPQGLCATTTFTLVVNAVNDLPIVTDDNFSVNEDQTLSGTISNGEYDIEGNTLAYSAMQQPSNGELNLSSNGQFTYTPGVNWFGSESINIQVCDQQNGCTQTLLTVAVNSVNDIPVAEPASINTNEDNPISGTLNVYTGDIESSQLTYSVQTTPASGSFNLTPSGSYTFTPAANYNGTVSASYQACDASNACVTGILSIQVASINDAPIAQNVNLSMNEDQTSIGIATGISDVDNSSLTITLSQDAQNGTFTLSNAGAYSYIPNSNYFGSETIGYTVCDPLGVCASGQFVIQVISVEDFPLVAGESIAVIEGNILTGDASENDSDGDGDPLTYTIVSSALNGALTFNNNGTFTYTPNTGFLGTETINYMVCDDNGNCASTTLTIDVLTANTEPIAASSTIIIPEDEVLSDNLLAYITDAEGGIFVFTTIQAPQHGTLLWTGNGAFTYSPSENYAGEDVFIYRVCDNGGLCTQATVSLTIAGVNDSPVVNIEFVELQEDESLSQDIGTSNSDAEGDAITYTLIAGATNGAAQLSSDGVFVYNPNENFFGTDQITYTACDINNACTEAVLSIHVSPVNDIPEAQGMLVTIQEDETITGSLSTLVLNVDNDALFFGTMIAPSNGAVLIQNNGSFSYIPDAHFFGSDQFTYLTCDPSGQCDTASIILTIVSVNDTPQVNNDSAEIDEDSSIEMNLAANDFEVENESLSYSLISTAQFGTATVSATGLLNYIGNSNAFGIETLVVSICDSQGACGEATVEITISSVNDLPVILENTFEMNEDGVLTEPLFEYTTDVESATLTFLLNEEAEYGLLVLSASGTFTYAPNNHFNGIENISFQACDENNGCTQGNIQIHVVAVNDSPQAQNTQITLSEDSATQGNFQELASDADGEELFFNIIQNTEHGTFITDASGTFAFAPTANYFGLDTLYYSVCDASGACDTALISFEITFVNDLPIINNEGVQIIMNDTFSGSVAANDIELDFEPLVYTLVEDNSGGTFTLQSDGSYTYIPALDTTGIFSVNYAACDPCSACEFGTITLLVVSEEDANTPPIASTFIGQTCPGGSIAISLLNSISDNQESSDALSLSFGTVNSGNYQLDAETQELIYQASPFATGAIVIPYYVCDNGIIQMCDTAEIVLEILPQTTIEITGFQTEQISCYGANDGSIEISASTSLGNINYSWSNGSESSAIDFLSSGIYSVIISSDAPCPINQTAQFEIFEPVELLGSYSLIDTDGTNSTIGDSILISISGGTPGYTVNWNTPNGATNGLSIEISANGEYSYTITDSHDCTFSESIIIAGIQDSENNSPFSIYPNPVDGQNKVQIKGTTEIIKLEVLDSKGAIISSESPRRNGAILETTHWSSGIYSIRIHTNREVSAFRLIKQ